MWLLASHPAGQEPTPTCARPALAHLLEPSQSNRASSLPPAALSLALRLAYADILVQLPNETTPSFFFPGFLGTRSRLPTMLHGLASPHAEWTVRGSNPPSEGCQNLSQTTPGAFHALVPLKRWSLVLTGPQLRSAMPRARLGTCGERGDSWIEAPSSYPANHPWGKPR